MRNERTVALGKWRAKGYVYASKEGQFIWLSFSFTATARSVGGYLGIAGVGVGFNFWNPANR